MFENGLWLLVIVGGPLVIGLLLAWALISRRRLTRQERELSRRKTQELYRQQPR